MNQIISKRVDGITLDEGDIIQTGYGIAEVQHAENGWINYMYLDSGDCHERELQASYTVYLEHPAIGKARKAGRID